MPDKNTLPTLEGLIISGNPALLLRERPVLKTLIREFDGSIAPLLLSTDDSLKELKKYGPKTRQLVKQRLDHHGLRISTYDESMVKRAVMLYGSLDKVPIQALHLFTYHMEPVRYTHFSKVRLVTILAEFDETMTIGELTEMSRTELRKYLAMKQVAIETPQFDAYLRALRDRLKNWGVGLKGETAKATSHKSKSE